MRGVEAELDGSLKGDSSEVGEEITDPLLAGVDDLANGCPVDSGGHSLAKLLETTAHLLQESSGGQGGFGGDG